MLTPPHTRIITPLVVLLIVLAIGGLSFVPMPRTATALGYLETEPAIVRVFARDGGVFDEVLVQDGLPIKKGAPLFRIRLDRSSGSGGSAEDGALAALVEQANQLAVEREAAVKSIDADTSRLQNEAAGLRESHDALVHQAELQGQAIAEAKRMVVQAETLLKSGAITRNELVARRQVLLQAEREGAAIAVSLRDMEAKLRDTEQQIAAQPLKVAQLDAKLAQNKAELNRVRAEVEGRQTFVVRAATDGEVTGVQARAGEVADPRRPALTLIPEGAITEAVLLVPSRAAGFIKLGQKVRLQYDAFPYQKFGFGEGTVTSISQTIFVPGEGDFPVAIEEPVYRVRVALAQRTIDAFGEARRLQPGTTLSARIVLEERTVLEWLLEPIYACGSRI